MSDHCIGVMASGRGSNLQAIMDACSAGTIPGHVALVISDNPDAYALHRASKENIPAFCINPTTFDTKDQYEQAVSDLFIEYGVELICLAGYMRLVGRVLLKKFATKMLNIHPALLPSFPGLHAQEQAVAYGVKYSGCTVHVVDEGMDTGPIVLQAAVPVIQDDTPDSLSERILEQEHKIYPQAIKLLLEGRLKIEGRKVEIL
ncbi:MAG: phosphoribosylglycinamide formyltransferase [Firmicutes bacterium]|nr:phosphoribosylglycinamide formyltransferase [Bacillota bacterium]